MANFREQLEDMTKSADDYFEKEGRYPGTSTKYPENLNQHDESNFRRDLHSTALAGKNHYYMMAIEPEHQEDPKLFDPLEHSPDNKWWPHQDMFGSLKGRAKAVCNWAVSNGLSVTISDVKKHDPVRGEYVREYWLVISWAKAKAAQAA